MRKKQKNKIRIILLKVDEKSSAFYFYVENI
nr:MAG TPA: hypothetical protein [Caudoviricetes sp.]